MPLLEIKNLEVEADGKEILQDINMKLEKGRIYVLMGLNGSGKTTLANILMGNPKYKINKGKILFNGKSINDLSPDERAKKGIFMSFQSSVEISGVTLSNFIRASFNSLGNKMSILEFQKLLNKKCEELGIKSEFLGRYVNAGSGGEKKKMEMLQMLVLNPKFAVIDEIDSGLDEESRKFALKCIAKMKSRGKTILVITHYKDFSKKIKPDKILKLKSGKILE